MKNAIVLILIFVLLFSCKKEPKDYATITGKITNVDPEVKSITLLIDKENQREIALNADGTFEDTIKIAEGDYMLKVNNEYLKAYLKNGEEINITTDYKEFDEQLKFTGEGQSAKVSNLFANFLLLQEKYLNAETIELPKNEFDAKMEEYKTAYTTLKESNNEVDAVVWKELDADFDNSIKSIDEFLTSKQALQDKFTGQTSPSFAYEDINGKQVKLADFKGKYVYVDVWATWCGPCKQEIPHLKKLDEEYKDKNIEFVSISVDVAKDKEKWSKFVAEQGLTGVQLFADNDWNSTFVQEFEIRGIPRFILIDPNGKVLDPDAPRPSSPKLKEILNSQKI